MRIYNGSTLHLTNVLHCATITMDTSMSTTSSDIEMALEMSLVAVAAAMKE